MSEQTSIGVGVLGLGFMGQTHVRAYQAAAKDGLACRLVAACDQDADRRAGRAANSGNMDAGDDEMLFDPAQVRGYAEPAQLFADDSVGLVSICTHTDSHVDLAIEALAAGKHVLVEKPVAISSADVARLAHAASESDRVCMPAMCMRFWPGWDLLRDAIADGRYGAVQTARFERLGAPPSWTNFYTDTARSGDALFDLHIHDVDFVHACFGKPDAVTTVGRPGHASTVFQFEDGPGFVIAEGGWLSDPSAEFRMRFVVEFESALAEFDLAGEPAMKISSGGKPVEISLADYTGWEGEVRHLVAAIASGDCDALPTIDDALAVTRTLEAELESLRTGRAAQVATS